jgi:hypothetical protein
LEGDRTKSDLDQTDRLIALLTVFISVCNYRNCGLLPDFIPTAGQHAAANTLSLPKAK